MERVTLLQKTWDIPFIAYSTCGNPPTGTWKFTTTSCVPSPANPTSCNVYCLDPTAYLKANLDKSEIIVSDTSGGTPTAVLKSFASQPLGYSGCLLASPGVCGLQYLGMTFAPDYRSAPFTVVGVYGDACIFEQAGTAVLQGP